MSDKYCAECDMMRKHCGCGMKKQGVGGKPTIVKMVGVLR